MTTMQESWQGHKARWNKPQKTDEVLFPSIAKDAGLFVFLSSGNRRSMYKKGLALGLLVDCPLFHYKGEKTHNELISVHKSKLKRHALAWLLAQTDSVELLSVNYRRQLVAFGVLQQVDGGAVLGYSDYEPGKDRAANVLASLPDVVRIPDTLA